MKTETIIIILIILFIGILIGYFLPTIIQSTAGIGAEVFGTSSGISPPAIP